MKYNIITISRQFGSAGRTIGKELAAELGIPCYDSEIIEKVAEESGMDKDYIKDKGEYSGYGRIFASGRNFYTGLSNEDQIWIIQSKVIRQLAEKGPCVIVGRCADYILKDRDDVLKVFIHADMEFRANRIVNVYGESDEAPEKRLKDKDRRRKAFYELYTDMKWGKSTQYDITLNSGHLGIDRCVGMLAEVVRSTGEKKRSE